MTKRILTKEVLAGIPAMVARGQHAAEIAEALGCKLDALKVRCSLVQISLRPLDSFRRPREQRSIKINKAALQLPRAARLNPPLPASCSKSSHAIISSTPCLTWPPEVV